MTLEQTTVALSVEWVSLSALGAPERTKPGWNSHRGRSINCPRRVFKALDERPVRLTSTIGPTRTGSRDRRIYFADTQLAG